MPFLLAKILNFQGTVHLIGVGSLSYLFLRFTLYHLKKGEIDDTNSQMILFI